MFDGIAERYDLLNRIISLGIDQSWRKRAVAKLELSARGADDRHVLDLATGTGDLAIMITDREPASRVTGVDPSSGMLGVGQRKLVRKSLSERIQLEVGDAQELQFEDNSFDGVTIAFGIRFVVLRLASNAADATPRDATRHATHRCFAKENRVNRINDGVQLETVSQARGRFRPVLTRHLVVEHSELNPFLLEASVGGNLLRATCHTLC